MTDLKPRGQSGPKDRCPVRAFHASMEDADLDVRADGCPCGEPERHAHCRHCGYIVQKGSGETVAEFTVRF